MVRDVEEVKGARLRIVNINTSVLDGRTDTHQYKPKHSKHDFKELDKSSRGDIPDELLVKKFYALLVNHDIPYEREDPVKAIFEYVEVMTEQLYRAQKELQSLQKDFDKRLAEVRYTSDNVGLKRRLESVRLMNTELEKKLQGVDNVKDVLMKKVADADKRVAFFEKRATELESGRDYTPSVRSLLVKRGLQLSLGTYE